MSWLFRSCTRAMHCRCSLKSGHMLSNPIPLLYDPYDLLDVESAHGIVEIFSSFHFELICGTVALHNPFPWLELAWSRVELISNWMILFRDVGGSNCGTQFQIVCLCPRRNGMVPKCIADLSSWYGGVLTSKCYKVDVALVDLAFSIADLRLQGN